MKKITIFVFTLISFLISTASHGAKGTTVEKNCRATAAQWNKCKGRLPKGIKGDKILISARSEKKDECYAWVGKAEYSCDNGKWIIEKFGQTCNWDCICCY
ncbi:MAG: hypothetical protein H7177_00490 [Rhizobacter sp.]|nr:hypothetical protein [Bacteriovorax sp.]